MQKNLTFCLVSSILSNPFLSLLAASPSSLCFSAIKLWKDVIRTKPPSKWVLPMGFIGHCKRTLGRKLVNVSYKNKNKTFCEIYDQVKISMWNWNKTLMHQLKTRKCLLIGWCLDSTNEGLKYTSKTSFVNWDFKNK